jgi:hypothetical protein
VTYSDSVEVAHEALIAQWGTLREWLEEDREGHRVHRHLTRAAQEWESLDRDPGELYRGARLAQAEEWASAGMDVLNSLERRFIGASLDQRDREKASREAQRQLELQLAKERASQAEAEAAAQARSSKRLRVLVVVLALLLPYPAFLGIQSVQKELSGWQPVEGFPRGANVSALAVSTVTGDPSSMLYCAGMLNLGIGCSQDGKTWNIYQRSLPTGMTGFESGTDLSDTVRGISLLAFDSIDPNKFYASVFEHGLYRTENGGLSWYPAEEGLPIGARISLAARDELILLAFREGTVDGWSYRLYVSLDGGQTWELTPVAGGEGSPSQNVYSVHLSPDGQSIYVGAEDGLYRGSVGSPWIWKQVEQVDMVLLVAPDLTDQDNLYLASYDPKADQTSVYRWRREEGKHLIGTVGGPPRSLAPEPDSESITAVYILLNDGTVFALAEGKKPHKLGKRPGLAQALVAAPSPDSKGTWLLLGHADGLLTYDRSLDFGR